MEYECEPSKEDISEFREWLKKMPHIVQDYDDKFLEAFVRYGKGSLQKAKDRLENFNKIGMEYPELFGSLDPLHPELQEHLSTTLLFPLPKKTDDDCTLFFLAKNPKCQDPTKYHTAETYRYYLLSIYVLLWENNLGSGKWKFFSDCRGFTLAHVADVTPTSAKRQISAFNSNFPIRFKSSTLVELPTVVEWVMNVYKSATKKKLAERIHILSNLDEVEEKNFSRKILPKEYGGCEESAFVLHENWKKKVESYRERLLEEERKMRKLDSLRPKTCYEDEMTGTFRRLNVD